MPLTLNFPVAASGALTLAWTSGFTAYDPVFTLTTYEALVGDILTLEVDDSSGFGSLHDSESDTLSGPEIADGSITYGGFTTLLPGITYYARIKLQRGVEAPVYSNTVNQTMFIDTTPPTVTSYSPLDNATSVVIGIAELVVTFNETVLLGTGTISLKKTSDNTTVDSWNVATAGGSTAGKVEVTGGNTLHIRLTTSLPASTELYVVWPTTVIRDVQGNNVAAQSSTTAWSFTTGLAPTGWTPLLATTAAIWWVDASNAASITKVGTAPNERVTQLNDLTTGTQHHMTPSVGGNGPYYVADALIGQPGLSFTSNSDLRTVTSFTRAQPLMLVVVWKQIATPAAAYAILIQGDATGTNNGFMIMNRYASANYAIEATFPNLNQNVPTVAGTAYHSRVVWDGNTTSSKLNASTVTGVTGPAGIVAGIVLGNADVANNGPNAIICEAFIIPYANHAAAVANAPTDATNVDAYVLAKWGVGGSPAAGVAPVLDLIGASDLGSSSIDNITTNTTPSVNIDFMGTLLAGDVVKLYDNGTLINTHVITAGEADFGDIDLGLSALSSGSHPITCTHTRGATVSLLSAPLTITIGSA